MIPFVKQIHCLKIYPAQQRLWALDAQDLPLVSYPVSTSGYGLGERKDSLQTPRGWHAIYAKIGEGQPINAIFKGRVFTGQCYEPGVSTTEDMILTRILWLMGLEAGKNQGGDCDTRARYIYLHGTPAEDQIGTPASHGCVRLGNHDMITLFEQVPLGLPVYIADLDETFSEVSK